MESLQQRLDQNKQLRTALSLLDDALKQVQSLKGVSAGEIEARSTMLGWYEKVSGATNLSVLEQDQWIVRGYGSYIYGLASDLIACAWAPLSVGGVGAHNDHFKRAIAHYEAAIQAFEQVAGVDVRELLARTHFRLGEVQNMLRRPDLTAFHFRRTVECYPDSDLALEAEKRLAVMGVNPQVSADQLRTLIHDHAGSRKSKAVAMVLAVVFGGLGAHGFYLGNRSMAWAMLGLMLMSWVLQGMGVVFAPLAFFAFCCFQAYRYHAASPAEFGEKYVLGKAWV